MSIRCSSARKPRVATLSLKAARSSDSDQGEGALSQIEAPRPVPVARLGRTPPDQHEGQHRHDIGNELEELRRDAGDLRQRTESAVAVPKRRATAAVQ